MIKQSWGQKVTHSGPIPVVQWVKPEVRKAEKWHTGKNATLECNNFIQGFWGWNPKYNYITAGRKFTEWLVSLSRWSLIFRGINYTHIYHLLIRCDCHNDGLKGSYCWWGFYTWIFAQSSLLLVPHPDAYPKWVYGRFHILVVGFLRWCNLMDSMFQLKQAHLDSLSIIRDLMNKALLQTEPAFNNLMVIFAAALVGGNSAEVVSHDLDLGCHISYFNKDFLTLRLSFISVTQGS